MSKEFEKKIEELFLHKEKIIDSNLLEALIREGLNNKKLFEQEEEISLQDFYKSLPKVDINELLGNNKEPGKDARNNFKMMIGNVVADPEGANPTSLEEKLIKLTQYIISKPNPEDNISDTLNKLFFLKGMQQLLLDYTGRISGTLFESFIAAITGGETIGKTNDIDDVLLPDNQGKLNLKFIKIESPATGSLRLALKKYAVDPKNVIDFYIAYKGEKNDKIIFYHVVYDYSSFINLQSVRELLVGAGITAQEIKNLNANIKIVDQKLLQFKDKVKDIQFKLPYSSVRKRAKPIVLNISEKEINNILRNYDQVLNNNLKTIYYNLALLTSGVNSFYLQGSMEGATKGMTAAKKIEDTFAKATSSNQQK